MGSLGRVKPATLTDSDYVSSSDITGGDSFGVFIHEAQQLGISEIPVITGTDTLPTVPLFETKKRVILLCVLLFAKICM